MNSFGELSTELFHQQEAFVQNVTPALPQYLFMH